MRGLVIFIETFRTFSADDGSDQALQRMLGQINNDNLECFLDGDLNLKEGLGKLDDNMMRYIFLADFC